MRLFAEVNSENIVVNVALFEDDKTPVDLGWTGWYETAENIRKTVAGPGSTFVPQADGYPLGLFYQPCPHETWVLDANYDWQPPTPKPEGNYIWDDETNNWVEVFPHEEE